MKYLIALLAAVGCYCLSLYLLASTRAPLFFGISGAAWLAIIILFSALTMGKKGKK